MKTGRGRRVSASFLGTLLAAALPVVAAAQTGGGTRAGSETAGRVSAAQAWAQAVTYADESEQWVAGSSDITMEQLNRRGESQQAVRLEQTAIKNDDSIEVSMSVVSATAGMAYRMEASGGGSGSPGDPGGAQPGGARAAGGPMGGGLALDGIRQHPANPFSPAVRNAVAIEATGAARSIGGQNSVEYNISWSTDEGVFTGTIWLTEQAHVPVRLEVAADLADDQIRAAHLTTTFETDDGLTVLSRAVVQQSVRINLFITAHTRMTVSFDDYFKTNGTEELIVRGLPGMEE
jgi:hypothetical protein